MRIPSPPLVPFPSLPVMERVRVEVGRDNVVVVQDVVIARGDWNDGDLRFFIAFGAPGVPRAFDARLRPASNPINGSSHDTVGEPVSSERAPRKPKNALALLGPQEMAGEVVRIEEPAFRRATAAGDGRAVLRLRSLLDMPSADASGAHELVVRLGAPMGIPIALQAIEAVPLEARPTEVRIEAHYCGPKADAFPLAIGVESPIRQEGLSALWSVAALPSNVVRHSSDSLCLRLRLP